MIPKYVIGFIFKRPGYVNILLSLFSIKIDNRQEFSVDIKTGIHLFEYFMFFFKFYVNIWSLSFQPDPELSEYTF